jgi:hypothetical protein
MRAAVARSVLAIVLDPSRRFFNGRDTVYPEPEAIEVQAQS